MTTKLSERLRGFALDASRHLRPQLVDQLRELVAQAEAQEKLAYFEGRVKPSSDDPDAQAGELSDFHYNVLKERMIEEHRKYGDKLRFGHWADIAARKVVSHLSDMGYLKPSQATPVITHLNMDPNASPETIEAVKDMVQKAYSYKPSQAIGEQTPVAWMAGCLHDYRMDIITDAWKKDAPSDGNMSKTFTIPLYRSPMSSEARDKAITMFEKIWLSATSHGRKEPYASQAEAGLSALRERSTTP